MRRLIVIVLLACISTACYSQYKIGLLPRSSPDSGLYEKIGYTGIEITYGSPRTHGRIIWGNLVPYETVWRAGANDATRIEFTEDVEIEGHFLERGIYALFIIPRENAPWTVIFNNDYDQWGAFNYNSDLDQLRIDVSPCTIEHVEKLRYTIDNQSFEDGVITMEWDNIKLDLSVKTKYLKILQREIEAGVESSQTETRSVIYLQGAEYLLRRLQYLDIASKWINNAEDEFEFKGEWNKQYYPREYILGHIYWTKAKILATQKKYSKAIKYGNKMKELRGKFNYYKEENSFEKIDEQIQDWILKS